MILLPLLYVSFVRGFTDIALSRQSGTKRTSSSSLAAKRIPRSPSAAPRQRPIRRNVEQAPIRRAPHQFDHTKDTPRPFLENPAEYVASQIPNENSSLFDVSYPGVVTDRSMECEVPHVRKVSLDELFPGIGFSDTFATSESFRTELRNAIREDVFDEFYSHITNPKARAMLLLPDSSLQGGWNLNKMARTDAILLKHLGQEAPSGKSIMETIGGLCGDHKASSTSHWMDIIGVPNRKIPYSWHQDRNDGKGAATVLWGFPKRNAYKGTGVFSHVIKLRHPAKSSDNDLPQQPIVYDHLQVNQEFIHRPCYGTHAELIMYHDANVLHSAPDVTYRDSLMRFML